MVAENLLVNLRCPHCNAPQVAAVSGYCREGLNVRDKDCKSCENTFAVVLFTETTIGGEGFDDLELAGLRKRIMLSRKERVRKVNRLRRRQR